jgi:hypothetical protein
MSGGVGGSRRAITVTRPDLGKPSRLALGTTAASDGASRTPQTLDRLIASGRILKVSWAVWCSAPFCFPFFTRLGECTSYTLCVEVFAVNRRSGLLTP